MNTYLIVYVYLSYTHLIPWTLITDESKYFQVQLVCANEHAEIRDDIIRSETLNQLGVQCEDDKKGKKEVCSCYLNRIRSSSSYRDNPGTDLYQSYNRSHSKWKDFGFMKQEHGCNLLVNDNEDEKFEMTAICGEKWVYFTSANYSWYFTERLQVRRVGENELFGTVITWYTWDIWLLWPAALTGNVSTDISFNMSVDIKV